EMLELSACGAKVLMLRCVEYARRTGMPLHVRSSFTDASGTWVREEDERMEKAIVSGVPHDTSEAKVTLVRVPDKPGIAARVMRGIAEHGVNVDMIVQNVSHGGTTDISFTVPKTDLAGAMAVLQDLQHEVGAAEVVADSDIAKVSLVGAGMKSSPGVAAAMFDALAEAGVNIEMISTSTIRISCVIRSSDVGVAVRAIHDRFHLSEEAEFRHDHPDGTAEPPGVRPAPPPPVPPVRGGVVPPRPPRRHGRAAGGPVSDPRRPTAVIVGATGAVGEDLRRLVAERELPVGEVRLVASARSAGRRLPVRGEQVEVRALAPEVFDGADLAFFSAGGGVSREWGPVAAERGAVVVDNSSGWRMHPQVPLVDADVNPEAALGHPLGIVAQPDCPPLAMTP